MSLEQVHIKAISEITSNIEIYTSDRCEGENLTDILNHLQELTYNGERILKSIGAVKLFKINKSKMAGSEDPVKITYSCDSGSTNSISFDNGLFINFCHAAIATTPTNLEIHKKRTIVSVVYSTSKGIRIRTSNGWNFFDEDASRWKLIQIESGLLKKRIDRMVHDITLYLAESEHILWNLSNFVISNSDKKLNKDIFFIMDGPIYPKGLIYWMVLRDKDIQIYNDPITEKILQNYIDIMDYHLEKRIPIIGFVKNPEDSYILNVLKSDTYKLDLSWVKDSQFFKAVLSNHIKDEKNSISYTNWFIQPNQFYKTIIEKTSPIASSSVTHKFENECYSIAFFIVYVPDMDVIFKIESPYGLIKEDNIRAHITKKVLYDLSVHGIPITLTKSDSIAKIRISEKNQIIGRFKNIKLDTIYNNIRWNEIDE